MFETIDRVDTHLTFSYTPNHLPKHSESFNVPEVEQQNSLQDMVFAVNGLLKQRVDSKRRDLALALKLGRLMCQLRDMYRRGEWGEWVTSNTHYTAMHEAQADMRLWSNWRSTIVDKHGDDDQSITRFVDTLSDDNVSVSVSSLQLFAKEDVSPYARELAHDYMTTPDNSRMTSKISERIIETARVVESLSDEMRPVAQEIIDRWGVSNPETIRRLPMIAIADPEMLETIRTTGTMSVPGIMGGDGAEVAIENVGIADIELAVGETKAEQAQSRFANYTSALEFMKQIESSSPTLIVELLRAYLAGTPDANTEDGEVYQIRLYKKVKKPVRG